MSTGRRRAASTLAWPDSSEQKDLAERRNWVRAARGMGEGLQSEPAEHTPLGSRKKAREPHDHGGDTDKDRQVLHRRLARLIAHPPFKLGQQSPQSPPDPTA